MRSEQPGTTSPRPRRGRIVCLAGLLALLVAPALAQPEADYEKLLADKSPAIVTVKFLMKMKSSWGDHEAEQEVPGVIIGKDGLIMCANSHFGGGAWMRNSGVTVIPADFKVLIGADTEGVEADLLARDTDLDLAWLKLKNTPAEPLTVIELSKAATPTIGERMYCISRLGKYFDRIAVVAEMRVGGSTTKPRQLIVPSGGSGAVGLPVYAAAGQIVGVSITQVPEDDESSPGGQGGGVLILPADKVQKATERALATATGEEDEEAEPSAPKSEEKHEQE